MNRESQIELIQHIRRFVTNKKDDSIICDDYSYDYIVFSTDDTRVDANVASFADVIKMLELIKSLTKFYIHDNLKYSLYMERGYVIVKVEILN